MSAAPAIPIENIYYLFCYAWNRFEEASSIPVGGMNSPDLPNLLARVLLYGMRTLLRRGLDRGYQAHDEELATVRGHIDLGQTMRLQARQARRIDCEFDELSHDVHHNRVLKASLKRLARANSLDAGLAHELRALASRLTGVTDIWLERSAFARVQLHRNNAYYDLMLKVAALAFDCLLPDPSGDGFRFRDVLRDETKMARVFEDFVFNFYATNEETGLKTDHLTIHWDAVALTPGEGGRLPNMRVDAYLHGNDRHVIIDTKYYADALQHYHGSASLRSAHLYQLFSYLKNASANDNAFASAEGILLYPHVGPRPDAMFDIQGHQVKVATVDLARPWPEIAAQLISTVVRL